MEKNTYEWKREYELGIEDIDFQHHFFFNLILRLTAELTQSQEQVYQNALVDELIAYARFHFVSEENMMSRAGYPKLEEHKHLHHELLDQLSTKSSLLSLTHSAKDSNGLLDFLMNWFFQHTTGEDKLFAQYLGLGEPRHLSQ